jgi:hypothetical protein
MAIRWHDQMEVSRQGAQMACEIRRAKLIADVRSRHRVSDWAHAVVQDSLGGQGEELRHMATNQHPHPP